MRAALGLLLLVPLAAQEATAPRPQLAPPGCWELSAPTLRGEPAPAPKRSQGAATVEVWGVAFQESPRQTRFASFTTDLRARLSRAWAAPPPSHGSIELSELVGSDPTRPDKLDLTRVKSLQDRFNPPPRR